MARPRQTPPTSSATVEQPPNFDAYVAAATAGELLPPEAAVGVVPVGGALTVAAGTAAVAGILNGFDAFTSKRRRRLREYLTVTLPRLNPDRTPSEIAPFVRDEMARDREFVRNQRDRLERDLKLAMELPTMQERAERVQAILDREKRYTQMREQAALQRANARTNFLNVRDASPEGAFWVLGLATVHTPDCVAMSGHFWPWEVLDAIHPLLHHGCQCELLTKQEAVERGLMRADQVPDTADALRRAREIAQTYDLLHEHASAAEIREATERRLEEVRRIPLRYAKGTKQGGEFMPRGAVGTPVERLMRKLIPHAPTTAFERRQIGYGQFRRIAGREVFVPEHRVFEREIGGRMWYSPPGTTEVYEQKALLRRNAPEIPRERGSDLSDTAWKQRQEWRADARAVAERALAAQTREVRPAEIGAHPKATHSGMLDAGFRMQRQEISTSSSAVTHHYLHASSGAEAKVTYGDHKVTAVVWQPGRNVEVSPPLERPPTDVQEFLDDVHNIVHDLAARHDRVPHIGRIQINDSSYDSEGTHFWDGTMELGPDTRLAVAAMNRAREEGRPLNYRESRVVYNAYRTAVHEALHAAAPVTQRHYQGDPVGRALEEALTEELASVEVVDVLRRQGLDDVLRWVKANPSDTKVEGSYSHYRRILARVLDRGNIAPEKRENVMDVLKWSFEPEQRIDGLAALVTEAGRGHVQNHDEAKDWIRTMFTKADKWQDHNDVIFVPNIRPDLHDVPAEPPVLVLGQEVLPGSWVTVRGNRGQVQQIYRRDDGNLFDVQYGTTAAPTRVDHGVHEDQIDSVGAKPQGQLPGAGELRLGSETIRPGDVLSWKNPAGRTYATVERIVRVQNTDLKDPARGWQIEARTHDGEPVMLTHDRTRDLRKEVGMRSPGGGRDTFADFGPVPVDPPKWKQIGPGVLDSEDGRLTMYRIEGLRPTAWNVEFHTDYAWEVQGADAATGYADPIYSNIVDGAATRKDAEALFKDAWPEVRQNILTWEGERSITDGPAKAHLATLFAGYKPRADRRASGISPREVDAIHLYQTAYGFQKINGALRADDPNAEVTYKRSIIRDNQRWGYEDVKLTAGEWASALDRAIEQAPAIDTGLAMYVHRGVRDLTALFGPVRPSIGQRVTDKAFVSTSTDIDIARNFAENDDAPWVRGTTAPAPALLRIEVPSGQQALWVSGAISLDMAEELVLPRGSTFEVTDVYDELGKEVGTTIPVVEMRLVSSLAESVLDEVRAEWAKLANPCDCQDADNMPHEHDPAHGCPPQPVALQEAAFDDRLHPRDRVGRWVETGNVDAIEKAIKEVSGHRRRELKRYRTATDPNEVERSGIIARGHKETIDELKKALPVAKAAKRLGRVPEMDAEKVEPQAWMEPPPPDDEHGAPIDVKGDVDLAAKLLGEGKRVQLSQPHEVSTLLDKLREVVAEAKQKGESAPMYDLCKVSVRGTNLFCAESKGVPRVQMPQLRGVPTPGSKADALPKDANGRVALDEAFVEHLGTKNIGIEEATEKASFLRASQRELNGAKVAAIAQAIEGGTVPKPIFVSSDDYIVDGHHNWAGAVGADTRDNKMGDVEMQVRRIDMPITDLLAEAHAFTAEWGLAPQAVGDATPQAGTEQVTPRGWEPPPPPLGKQGESRGGRGYSSDEAYGTNTALGHVGEAAFVKILGGGRVLHPEGKGAQSPLDVHFDGYGFEVKAVSTKTLGYKATPKKHEIAQKEQAAQELGVKPALAIVVIDSDNGMAHAYYRDGLAGGRLSQNTGWNFLGSAPLDDPTGVRQAHLDPAIREAVLDDVRDGG